MLSGSELPGGITGSVLSWFSTFEPWGWCRGYSLCPGQEAGFLSAEWEELSPPPRHGFEAPHPAVFTYLSKLHPCPPVFLQ